MYKRRTHYRTFKFLIIVFSMISSISCSQNIEPEKWRHTEISPIDESQVITIITIGNKRYFMDGRHAEVPKDGYLLLDLSKVDKFGDGVSVCWNDSGYNWKIASAYAELIENKLDSAKFLFYQPLGEHGEPVSDGYLDENCGGVLIRENLGSRGDLKVKYIKGKD